MPVYKDNNGTWYVSVRYKAWNDEPARKVKRGFKTKREAADWERHFLLEKAGSLEMPFSLFVDVYKRNTKDRLKKSTWKTKESIIENLICPFFKDKRICDIKVSDVVEWQNEMIRQTSKNGKKYSSCYLKTVHNQLSSIFNHAVKYYDLPSNPAAKAGNMGKEKTKEMLFWTKDEYQKFSEAIMDKPVSFYAFEVLYWCGLRIGELLALTSQDIDFEKGTLSITKSYQYIDGEDIITDPKTPKSNRRIQMPEFLVDELHDYLNGMYKLDATQRIFPISKSYMHHEMNRGSAAAGIKRIRIHDLRHSHVSLLIEMGFSAVAIADRMGHESIDITYRYAHLFPTTQLAIAERLEIERG